MNYFTSTDPEFHEVYSKPLGTSPKGLPIPDGYTGVFRAVTEEDIGGKYLNMFSGCPFKITSLSVGLMRVVP